MDEKDQRICIVGAGPAGLSAAMYLEQKGYTNYTIYEQSGRVGGRAFSPVMKLPDGTQRTFEMGASRSFGPSPALRECEMFGGVGHEDGPVTSWRAVKENGTEPRQPLFAKRKNAAKINKLVQVVGAKYKGYNVTGHRGAAQGRYEGLAAPDGRLERVRGVNPNLKDLTLPFAEFLKRNDCEESGEFWRNLFTASGRGYFDEIPAAYVLKTLNAPAVQQYYAGGGVWTWKDGAQSIWENVNRRLQNPAHLNSEVVNIDRKDLNVFVTVNGRAEAFDKLIICTPLHTFLGYGNPRPDEEALFSKILYKVCLTAAVRVSASRMPASSYVFSEHGAPETCGRLLALERRWPDAPGQPLLARALCSRDNAPGVSLQQARDAMLRDIAACGCPVEGVESVQDQVCFAHISPADYAAGWYDEVEALQGWDNTYYAGEIMACGSMEAVAAYSRELVERFFIST